MSLLRAFAHQDALIAAAIDEFDARGYAKASLNRILERAGVSKGQFYHHFTDKQALYVALVELMIARKQAFFRARPPTSATPTSVFDTLRLQLRQGLAFAREDPQLERFARSFLRERGRPIYQAVMARFPLDQDAAVAALVDAGLARGEFTDALSPAFLKRAIAALLQAAPELLDAASIDDFDRGLDELITLLTRGLGRPRAGARTRGAPRRRERQP
ncbi:MAG: TetR/AcrR family transcriptional regulator, partial [Myxococcales bacterium]|nr:TetR/AcrR family transcriptional regulator [Myxococcales bacterium]